VLEGASTFRWEGTLNKDTGVPDERLRFIDRYLSEVWLGPDADAAADETARDVCAALRELIELRARLAAAEACITALERQCFDATGRGIVKRYRLGLIV
jgi:hypothetical protein